MMAGNPSWWSMLMHPPNNSLHHHHLQPYSSLLSSSPSPSPSFPFSSNLLSDPQEHPQSSSSWSQLILSGSQGEDDRPFTDFQPKRFENWEEHQQHQMMINPYYSSSRVDAPDVKQELVPQTNNLYVHGAVVGDQFQAAWPQIIPLMPVSPRSCVTTLSSATTNVLDFSHTKAAATHNNKIIGHQHQDHSSECNSKATGGGGGVSKKARVQTSSSQPPLKVRKEKLGDRITALHQLVSPFGKTDTASVLLEAIGYIRFLQGQIEALSSPYLSTSSSSSAANMMRNQHCVQVDMNGAFPEDPGQLLNDTCLKRKGAPNQDEEGKSKDLKSRGLCLVPVSCTDQQVGNNVNGADYWAPAPGGGGF